jgi:hypothetical protein
MDLTFMVINGAISLVMVLLIVEILRQLFQYNTINSMVGRICCVIWLLGSLLNMVLAVVAILFGIENLHVLGIQITSVSPTDIIQNFGATLSLIWLCGWLHFDSDMSLLKSLYSIVMNFPDGGLCLANSKGKILSCNKVFSQHVGATLITDLLNENCNQFHPNPSEHSILIKSFNGTLIERPVEFVGWDNEKKSLYLTVLSIPGGYRIVRTRDKTRG